MGKNGNKPRRESKKLPKYAQEEIADHINAAKTTNQFVKIKKLVKNKEMF